MTGNNLEVGEQTSFVDNNNYLVPLSTTSKASKRMIGL
jgi:hypothetical protein